MGMIGISMMLYGGFSIVTFDPSTDFSVSPLEIQPTNFSLMLLWWVIEFLAGSVITWAIFFKKGKSVER